MSFEKAFFNRLERLATILPDNPYVLQHRSILERDLDNPKLAIEFARRALRLEPNNPALQNTLGLALESAAQSEDDPLRRKAFLSEATKLFAEIPQILIVTRCLNRNIRRPIQHASCQLQVIARE